MLRESVSQSDCVIQFAWVEVEEAELLSFLEEVRDARDCPYAQPWLQEALEE